MQETDSSQTQQAPSRNPFKAGLRKFGIKMGLYPHITLNNMPFKTYEFNELIKLSNLQAHERVLDLGCGVGTQTIIAGRKCRQIIGVDVSEEGIQTASAAAERFTDIVDAKFLCGKLEELNLEAESFDKILSFCVIEHIPNAEEVVAELYRLLKPGGQIILSADSLAGIDDPALISKHKADNFVHQYFRPDSLRSLLSNAGFKVDQLYPIFRSEHARKEFESGISKGFAYSYCQALYEYYKLKSAEAKCAQDVHGLFLIAKCHK